MKDSLKICVGYEKFFLERDGRNEERCMYWVCDFNGRWLKGQVFCVALLLY
jgi:hypothetical protein